MSKCIVKGESLIALANTIRDKSGTSDQLVFPDGFIDGINDIKAGSSDTDSLAAAIELGEAFTDYTNDQVLTVVMDAFYCFPHIRTVNLPSCQSVQQQAFHWCESMTDINLPSCTSIGTMAFGTCTSLVNVNIPNCKKIGDIAFSGCSSLTYIDCPEVITVSYTGFSGCKSLTTINLPKCITIEKQAFKNCSKLSEIYLNSSIMCTLENVNAFENTPYSGNTEEFSGTPYIYVPSNMIDAYKADTNWSQFSEYFKAIEIDNN